MVMSVAKKTELVCIIDRSGSMSACLSDAQGGFNHFIAEQKKLDVPCKVQLVQFDTEYEQVWKRQNLRDVGEYTLQPRGSTALLDAVGRTIANFTPKKDRNVIVVIVTDGEENSSREFSKEQVKKLVKEREADGWSFVFIGAGIDAFAEAGGIGISAHATLAASNSPRGYQTSYAAASQAVRRARRAGAPVQFTEEERDSVQ
jgi:Mg-chelatase subunit ChlD